MPKFDPFQPISKEEFKPSDLPGDDQAEGEVDPKNVGMEDNIDIGQDDAEASLDNFESELGATGAVDEPGGLELPEPTEVSVPAEPEKKVKWTTVPTDDNEIKSQHVGGFTLRSKPLSSKQGEKIKYITQLYKDKKILEKGVIWVDSNKDPRSFLQNIADRILNRMGLTSNEIEEEPKLGGATAEAGAPEVSTPEAGAEEPTTADLPKEEAEDELGSDMDEIMGSI